MYESILHQLNKRLNLQKERRPKFSTDFLVDSGFLIAVILRSNSDITSESPNISVFLFLLEILEVFLLLLQSTSSLNTTLMVYYFLSHYFQILSPLWDYAIFDSVWHKLLSLPWGQAKDYPTELHQGWKSRSEPGKERKYAPSLVLPFTSSSLTLCSQQYYPKRIVSGVGSNSRLKKW